MEDNEITEVEFFKNRYAHVGTQPIFDGLYLIGQTLTVVGLSPIMGTVLLRPEPMADSKPAGLWSALPPIDKEKYIAQAIATAKDFSGFELCKCDCPDKDHGEEPKPTLSRLKSLLSTPIPFWLAFLAAAVSGVLVGMVGR